MAPRRGRRRQRGMFLPALLVLGALGAVGWLLSHQTSAASRQLRQDMQTAHALAVAREALIGFAATYRNKEHPDADFGYLPCPDLDGDGSSETCGTKDQTSVGRLPYLTLNLPDLRDGAGECLWYAVAGSVKNNPKPDVLNWDSTGRFRLHDASGSVIALPGDQAGLAAALVIAAGPPRDGQHRSAGPARCGGDPEARNILHYVEALGATGGSDIIDVRPDAPGSNDRIAPITTGDIHRQLKRRSSYGPYLQSLLQATATCLAKSPLPAVVAPEALGPVELGRLVLLRRDRLDRRGEDDHREARLAPDEHHHEQEAVHERSHRQPRHRLTAEERDDRVQDADLLRAGATIVKDELPDDAGADEADRHRHEDHRLGEIAPPHAIGQHGDDQSEDG